jgi:general secretion pathway protein H
MGRPRWRGFTLVELLVVMAIAAALLAVTIPLLSGSIGRAELRGTAAEMAAALRHARTQAIRLHRETRLQVDLEQRRYQVSGERRAFRFPRDVDVKLVVADFQGLPSEAGEVRFYPDGSSSGGEITVSSKRGEYRVRVEWLTGRVLIHGNPQTPAS